MSSTTGEKFSCPSCDKKFAWKDDLAGKPVRCKCGHVFTAERPKQATSAPIEQSGPEIEAFDLYPEPEPLHRPKAATILLPPASEGIELPVESGPPVPSTLAGYAGHRRRAAVQEDDSGGPSKWKDTIVPAILAVLGIIGWVVMTVGFPVTGISPGKALFIASVMIVVNLVSMLLALFAAASLLSVNFGSPTTAILKLAGIAIFGGAVFFACMRLDYPQDVRGTIVGLHAAVFVYWICFATLFDLELQETVLTVAIIALMQAMAGCVVLKV